MRALAVTLRAAPLAALLAVVPAAMGQPGRRRPTDLDRLARAGVDVNSTASVRQFLKALVPDPARDAQLASLIEALGADAYVTRQRATRALGRLGVRALSALSAARAHPSAEVRRRIEGLLAALDAERTIVAAAHLLQGRRSADELPWLMLAVVHGPPVLRTPAELTRLLSYTTRTVQHLRPALSHPLPALRRAALRHLRRLPVQPDAWVDHARRALDDDDPGVRLAACELLVRQTPLATLAALVELLPAPDPAIGRRALALLRRETDADLTFDPGGTAAARADALRDWRRWLRAHTPGAPPEGLLRTLAGPDPRHAGPVRALAFGPDGQLLASSSAAAEVRLWSALSGEAWERPETGNWLGPEIVCAPDGRWVLLLGRAQRQLLRRVLAPAGHRGSTPARRPRSARPVTPGLRLEAPARQLVTRLGRLVSAADDGQLRVWSTHGLERRQRRLAHLEAVAIDDEGRSVAAFSGHDRLEVHVGEHDLRLTLPLALSRRRRRVTLSGDGQRIACTVARDRVQVWSLADGRRLLEVRATRVQSLALTHAGGHLAIGADARAVAQLALWDVASRRRRWTATRRAGVDALAFSPDGVRLASGGHDGRVDLWDVASGHELAPSEHGARVSGLAYGADGKTLVSADAGGRIVVWDLASGRPRRRLALDQRAPSPVRLSVSATGRRLAAASGTGGVRLWDLASGRRLHDIGAPAIPVRWLDLGRADVRWIQGRRLWRCGSADPSCQTLPRSDDAAVALTSDGRQLVWKADDATWQRDLRRGMTRRLLPLGGWGPIAASADGRVVAVATRKGIRVLRDGVPSDAVPVAGSVAWLALSPDTRWLAGRGEKTTWLLRLRPAGAAGATADPVELAELGPCGHAAFAPDSRSLACGYADGSLRIWRVGGRAR